MKSSPVSSVSCKKQGKLSIPSDEIISVIAKLEEKIAELDSDGKWRSTNSLWSRLADDLACTLAIQNTHALRKYIYTTWHRKSSKVCDHFINHVPLNDTPSNLEQLQSIPSSTTICTRSKTTNPTEENVQMKDTQEYLIEFSYEQWRRVSFNHRLRVQQQSRSQESDNNLLSLDLS